MSRTAGASKAAVAQFLPGCGYRAVHLSKSRWYATANPVVKARCASLVAAKYDAQVDPTVHDAITISGVIQHFTVKIHP